MDLQNKKGETALMRAAANGHTEMALALIEAGTGLDLQEKSGKTALTLAACYGHTEIAAALIGAGAVEQ